MQTWMWIARRVAAAAVALLGVSVLIFAAARVLPGDFVDIVAGPLASDELKQETARELGLDKDLFTQYITWITGALRGDLGSSYVTGSPIRDEIAARLPTTALIAVLTLFITLVLGLPIGFAAARARSRVARGAARLLSALGISLPVFVLGAVVVYAVSVWGNGIVTIADSQDGLPSPGKVILAAGVLSVTCVTLVARATRDAVLNARVEPYIAAAQARGESSSFIVRHHILRNISIPVLTVASVILADLLGGTIIVENILNIQGLGSYLVSALDRRDYLVIQAGVLLAGAVFVFASFVVDILSGYLDPRLRSRIQGAKS